MPEPRAPRSVQAGDAGRVYVGPWGGSIHVVDGPSGRLLGKIEFPFEQGSDWVFDRGRIYGVGSQGLVAHDVASSKRLFQTNIECASCQTRVVPGGERVFVLVRHPGRKATQPAEWAFAVDRGSGKVEWIRKLESPSPEDGEDAMPVFAGDTLVVPTEDGLLAVSPEAGAMRWISRAKAPRWLAVVEGMVYFASENQLFEVPLGGGPELWRLRLAKGREQSDFQYPDGLAITGDRIVYAHAGQLTALDRVQKQRIWQAEGAVLVKVSAGIALAQLDYQTAAAFDVAVGKKLWEARRVFVFDPPLITQDLVVVRMGPFARAFDARTGAERWELNLNGAP